MPLILEGIVTTQNPDGSTNIAPMGPIVESAQGDVLSQLLFRPFEDSQTCQNLLRHPEGVFHVTDDVLLFAQAVTHCLEPEQIELQPADSIAGMRLARCCGWHEFRITECDQQSPRLEMRATVLQSGRGQHWGGFNRAQFAVIEAAILATRLLILDPAEIARQWQGLETIIEKTAGPSELAAFTLLENYVASQARLAGEDQHN